jgi:phosphotransferase system HPr (HPr) family protein
LIFYFFFPPDPLPRYTPATLIEPSTQSREFTVGNKLGIHARPAAQFVKTASKFACDIRVEKDGEEVDGKSIMGLMMLAAGHGSVLRISAEGEDSEEAFAALAALIARNFEEN